jgi:hypothetical protein
MHSTPLHSPLPRLHPAIYCKSEPHITACKQPILVDRPLVHVLRSLASSHASCLSHVHVQRKPAASGMSQLSSKGSYSCQVMQPVLAFATFMQSTCRAESSSSSSLLMYTGKGHMPTSCGLWAGHVDVHVASLTSFSPAYCRGRAFSFF